MGANVTINWDKYDQKFSRASLMRGRLASANDAHQAMNAKFVPMLHSDSNLNLRGMSYVSNDGSQIIWKVPYARAQFYGMVGKAPGHPVKNYTTPGTSKRWDLRLKSRKDLMDQVEEAFVKGADWY
ncbi:capsid protein [Liquorilactobacillus satsumensis]|uniref:minor capsid protein n=1 Tax=Liquorilactobacillus TaxID=2767888 RepID=UPI0021C29610|nr:minor capsid protein [Liquorilactobacillus satsumensis]MCP9357375.1 capsid protein [Liquorilactobacillus satsumensis]MCP9372065.1 capsid protein [Liquorilactobacillus satsumensis]